MTAPFTTRRELPLPPPPGTKWLIFGSGMFRGALGFLQLIPEATRVDEFGMSWLPDPRGRRGHEIPARALASVMLHSTRQVRRASRRALREYRRRLKHDAQVESVRAIVAGS